MPNKTFTIIIITIALTAVAPHTWATEWTSLHIGEETDADAETRVVREMARRGFSEQQIEEARFTGQLIGEMSPSEIPTIATLQLVGLSAKRYYKSYRHIPLTSYYNKRIGRGAKGLTFGGIGMMVGGAALVGGGLAIISTSTDPWMLEELFGGLLVFIGTPVCITGTVLTAVGSVRRSRLKADGTLENASVEELNTFEKSSERRRIKEREERVALADRLTISPILTGDAQALSIGLRF